jgi:hypothetical protein
MLNPAVMRGWLSLVAVVSGCTFGVPVQHPEQVEQQAQRSAAIRPGESTRTNVIEALGMPWLHSDYWHVDVYRARDVAREVGGLVVLIYPVPLGVFKSEVEAYVMVVYDDAGVVTSVVSGSTAHSLGDQPSLMLRTAGLTLGLERFGKRGLHFMADGQHLVDYLHRRQVTGACTLVLACQEDAHEKWAYETCPDRVAVDDGPVLDPQPLTAACAAGQPCPAGESIGAPYMRVPLMLPLSMPPGRHRLSMSSSTFKGSHAEPFECSAGQVRYGVIRGHIKWHWWGPRKSTLDNTVTFEDSMPSDWNSHSMLLRRGDQWIAEQEPDRP